MAHLIGRARLAVKGRRRLRAHDAEASPVLEERISGFDFDPGAVDGVGVAGADGPAVWAALNEGPVGYIVIR